MVGVSKVPGAGWLTGGGKSQGRGGTRPYRRKARTKGAPLILNPSPLRGEKDGRLKVRSI
jgi:hypothetical protein